MSAHEGQSGQAAATVRRPSLTRSRCWSCWRPRLSRQNGAAVGCAQTRRCWP